MDRKRAGRAATWTGWGVCLALAIGFLGIFAWGILRDTHFEEGRVALDLGRSSPARAVPFRVWGPGAHEVHLTTVDSRSRPTDPVRDRREEPRFDGAIEVRLSDPEGSVRLREVLTGEALDHARPRNVEWTRIGALDLGGSPLRAWELQARVVTGDPAFANAEGYRSAVLVRKQRADAGMGGLLNYVMVIPGAVFAALALLLAVKLRRNGGSTVPVVLSLALLFLLGALWI